MKKRILSMILTLVIAMTTGISTVAYADTKVSVKQTKGSVASKGDTKATVIVEIKNTTSETLRGVKAKI